MTLSRYLLELESCSKSSQIRMNGKAIVLNEEETGRVRKVGFAESTPYLYQVRIAYVGTATIFLELSQKDSNRLMSPASPLQCLPVPWWMSSGASRRRHQHGTVELWCIWSKPSDVGIITALPSCILIPHY